MKKLAVFLFPLLASCSSAPSRQDVCDVCNYISASWERTVRENVKDQGSLIGVPYKYTVPSPEGMFQEMYYWDTFFTNEGLILEGRTDLAKCNTDNMLYLVGRFGCMLNGTRTWFIGRTQPPYLSMMIRRIYEETGDKEWLLGAYAALLKEYEFWQTTHMTPCGLNRYGGDFPDALSEEMAVIGAERTGMDISGISAEDRLKLGYDFAAEAESGWDFNPRFENRCGDFCPLDLNANLYGYECNFAFFSEELGLGDEDRWNRAAEQRKALIYKFCGPDSDGMFYDYDYVGKCTSKVVSGAVFSLLFNGLVSERDGRKLAKAALQKLEYGHGISVCEAGDYQWNYQWSYPNAWAPITYLAIVGLDRYGLERQARRIASKYVSSIISIYGQTGKLWEKYNVVKGDIDVNNEYEMPEMLGWTAGVFVYSADYLQENEKFGIFE